MNASNKRHYMQSAESAGEKRMKKDIEKTYYLYTAVYNIVFGK
jgi:hypothetical protein